MQLQRLAPLPVASTNGSLIHFGHWAGENSELEYNGQEYDWIFLDEATQFTWRAFQFLGGLLRGVNNFPKRMYITCNPGGVGHRWVKRLFIDRDFITDEEDPEASENPEDYVFIPATVEDNTALLRSSPAYVRMLASMPEDLRRAYRYGDWEALGRKLLPRTRGRGQTSSSRSGCRTVGRDTGPLTTVSTCLPAPGSPWTGRGAAGCTASSQPPGS